MIFRSPIIVLDTETTGFPSMGWAHVIELGAVLLDCDGAELGHFTQVVNPPVLDGRADKALSINGIPREEILAAPNTQTVNSRFLTWAAGATAVLPFVTAFNVDFDRPMVWRMGLDLRWASCIMLRAMEIMGPAGELKPADPMHPRYDPSRPYLWPSLAAAGEFFGVPPCEPAHRALSDARRAAGVAIAIQRRMKAAA